MHPPRSLLRAAATAAVLALAATACGSSDTDPAAEGTDGATSTSGSASATDAAGSETATATETGTATGTADAVTVYSGRGEDLVGSVLTDFTEQTGIEVDVRYGDTAELAGLLLEEGDRSPADLFWAQDAGALGAIDEAGLFAELPDDVLDRVEPANRADDGAWTGVTGRARTIVYSTERVTEDELPASVLDLTDEQYAGRVGWAPTNGSFQSFVTAMRVVLGEDTTREWLEGMLANDVQVYENNSSQVEAVGRGEIDFGLVNHYYLLRFLAENPEFPAENYFPPGDIGSLLNVAGVGVLDDPDDAAGTAAAEELVAFLLSDQTQQYFAGVTDEAEYPLVEGVEPAPELPELSELDAPEVDLSQLSDLQGTLELLTEVGALR